MKRFIAYSFICALALTSAAPTFAQSTDATFDAAMSQRISKQLIASLDSPVDQIKQETLQNVNFFATYHSDEIDLNGAVPKLIQIYETDKNEGYRILALVGLNAIGHVSVMRYLSETVRTERSPRVRALTLAAVAAYVRETTL